MSYYFKVSGALHHRIIYVMRAAVEAARWRRDRAIQKMDSLDEIATTWRLRGLTISCRKCMDCSRLSKKKALRSSHE